MSAPPTHAMLPTHHRGSGLLSRSPAIGDKRSSARPAPTIALVCSPASSGRVVCHDLDVQAGHAARSPSPGTRTGANPAADVGWRMRHGGRRGDSDGHCLVVTFGGGTARLPGIDDGQRPLCHHREPPGTARGDGRPDRKHKPISNGSTMTSRPSTRSSERSSWPLTSGCSQSRAGESL